MLSFFAVMILTCYYDADVSGRMQKYVNTEHFHDLAKFQFGFIVFWSYIAFLAVSSYTGMPTFLKKRCGTKQRFGSEHWLEATWLPVDCAALSPFRFLGTLPTSSSPQSGPDGWLGRVSSLCVHLVGYDVLGDAKRRSGQLYDVARPLCMLGWNGVNLLGVVYVPCRRNANGCDSRSVAAGCFGLSANADVM